MNILISLSWIKLQGRENLLQYDIDLEELQSTEVLFEYLILKPCMSSVHDIAMTYMVMPIIFTYGIMLTHILRSWHTKCRIRVQRWDGKI